MEQIQTRAGDINVGHGSDLGVSKESSWRKEAVTDFLGEMDV